MRQLRKIALILFLIKKGLPFIESPSRLRGPECCLSKVPFPVMLFVEGKDKKSDPPEPFNFYADQCKYVDVLEKMCDHFGYSLKKNEKTSMYWLVEDMSVMDDLEHNIFSINRDILGLPCSDYLFLLDKLCAGFMHFDYSDFFQCAAPDAVHANPADVPIYIPAGEYSLADLFSYLIRYCMVAATLNFGFANTENATVLFLDFRPLSFTECYSQGLMQERQKYAPGEDETRTLCKLLGDRDFCVRLSATQQLLDSLKILDIWDSQDLTLNTFWINFLYTNSISYDPKNFHNRTLPFQLDKYTEEYEQIVLNADSVRPVEAFLSALEYARLTGSPRLLHLLHGNKYSISDLQGYEPEASTILWRSTIARDALIDINSQYYIDTDGWAKGICFRSFRRDI